MKTTTQGGRWLAAWGLWVGAISCAGACECPATAGPRPPSPARGARAPLVRRIERAADLLGGPAARGRLGDYRLENGLIVAIIDKLGTGQGAAESGGNLVDIAPARGGADCLWQVFTYFAEDFPRQALYEEIATGTSATEAFVRVQGRDSADPRVKVDTWYVLAAGARHLVIRTYIENHGPAALRRFAVGDVIQWGHATRFLPGAPEPARGALNVPWGAGVGAETSFLYGSASAGGLGGIHGSAWSDFVVGALDVAPGAKAAFERFVAVGVRPDVASALEAAASAMAGPAKATHDSGRQLTGAVVEAGSGRPAMVTLVIHQETGGSSVRGGPVVTARSDARGRFAVALSPGRYSVTTPPGERAASPAVTVQVDPPGRPPPAPLQLVVSPSGSLEVRLTSGGAPSAGKVTLEGRDGTADPDLGPIHAAGGARNIAVTHDGRLRVSLPPGQYRATCSRGIEFDVDVHDVVVGGATPARLACELRRAVQTPGRIALDLHQHAVASSDAAVSLADRVTADLAEGLEGFAATDHNAITDYTETIRALGVGRRILALTGDEATTANLGHFNAYPLVADGTLPRGGAPPLLDRSAAQVFAALRALPPAGADKVVQVNHPRAGSSGYFDRIGLDPARAGFPAGWSSDFDAVEIVNGKRLTELDAALRDWMMLLRRGKVATAVGNSDTHAIFGTEAGYPRNMVAVPVDDPAVVTPADVVTAVKRRRDVVITNGPLLTVAVGDVGPGGTAARPAAGGAVAVRVRVEAAPWVDVDRVEVLVDGEPAGKPERVPASRDALRFDKTLRIPVRPGSFVIVVAKGTRPLHPVVPTIDQKPTTPVAIANPIWIAK